MLRGRALANSFTNDAVPVAVSHILIRRMPARTGAMPCRRASAHVILPLLLPSYNSSALPAGLPGAPAGLLALFAVAVKGFG